MAAKERELAYNSRFASNLVYTHQPDTAAHQQAPAGPEGATVAGYQFAPNPYTSAVSRGEQSGRSSCGWRPVIYSHRASFDQAWS